MSRVRLANAFPLPFTVPVVTSGDVGLNTLFPVGFSRADIIRFWWRVRTWKFTGLVFQASDSPYDTPTQTQTADATLENADASACADEKALIAAAGFAARVEGTAPIEENAVTISLFQGLSGHKCVQTGGMFYPELIGGDGGGSDPVNEGYGFTFLGVAYGAPGTHPERRSLDILGYWPYAGADGTAIYDAASGAQLLDPFAAAYP